YRVPYHDPQQLRTDHPPAANLPYRESRRELRAALLPTGCRARQTWRELCRKHFPLRSCLPCAACRSAPTVSQRDHVLGLAWLPAFAASRHHPPLLPAPRCLLTSRLERACE